MKDKPNWLQKLMIALTVIVFSPLIVVGIIILVVLNLFHKFFTECKQCIYTC